MLRLDPSPWLVIAILYLLSVGYLTYRGFAQNEFRTLGRSGWERYRAGSFNWCLATALNVMLFGAGVFIVYSALYKGAEFTREPALSKPEATGELVERAYIDKSPGRVTRCLTELNHAKPYENGQDSWLIVVRNGRNSVMYTFEVIAEGGGSRVDIRREQPSPFVNWKPCFRPGAEPA